MSKYNHGLRGSPGRSCGHITLPLCKLQKEGSFCVKHCVLAYRLVPLSRHDLRSLFKIAHFSIGTLLLIGCDGVAHVQSLAVTFKNLVVKSARKRHVQD